MTPKDREKRKLLRKRYLDLYGLEVLHLLLKNDGYQFCSFCKNSIPNQGSVTFPIEKCNPKHNIDVDRVIIHNNFDVTIRTDDYGHVRYLK